MTIDIKTLKISEVILALFENVYKKSEESKQRYANLIKMTPNIVGLYSVPFDSEIAAIARKTNHIDYIGCVAFDLTYEWNVIDVAAYDKIHNTGKNGIMTAAQVIEQLLQAKAKQTQANTIVPTVAASSGAAASAASFSLFSSNVDADKRFSKSNKKGVLYEASSYSYITDAELKQYGFRMEQIERRNDGIDNIVVIKQLEPASQVDCKLDFKLN